ncbi:MAG: ATP-binding cassette domain-containing protein [Halanaerobiaceae bacterium]
MITENTIVVEDLTKLYGELKAVDHISFAVNKGEIFGLLGPNGAGKTTLIKAIIGLINYNSGSCKILGQNVANHDNLYHKLGVVFEESTLYGRLSGYQNLKFFGRIFGVDSHRINQILEQYGLKRAASKRVNQYSKGMKQRLLICRALLHNPQIIILDEPTDGLDPNSARIIREAIKNFTEEGKTILLTTHYMKEADELCDRVAFINNGHIISMDTTENLKQKYGKRQLSIDFKAAGDINEEDIYNVLSQKIEILKPGDNYRIIISLDSGKLEDLIHNIRKLGKIESIHTKEASLEEVFRKLNQ